MLVDDFRSMRVNERVFDGFLVTINCLNVIKGLAFN